MQPDGHLPSYTTRGCKKFPVPQAFLRARLFLDSRRFSAYTACMPKTGRKPTAPRSSRRAVVLGLGISLDGYIARPDGTVDFLFMPKDYSMAPFFKTIDAAILGRKTYDVAQKMGGGGFGSFKLEYYVMSRTLPPGERDGLIFTSESPAALVARLRKKKGKNIWLMGGGELARAFLIDNLVDDLYLGIVPVLLGSGLPLFPPGFPQRNFVLTENKTFSRGLISLKYQRIRSSRK